MIAIRKQTRPVTAPRTGTCRWAAGNDEARSLLLAGMATNLLIARPGEDHVTYCVVPLADSRGLHGWRLVKVVGGDESDGLVAYDLPARLTGCSCPDEKHRHPAGGCRHQKALKAALTAIGLAE